MIDPAGRRWRWSSARQPHVCASPQGVTGEPSDSGEEEVHHLAVVSIRSRPHGNGHKRRLRPLFFPPPASPVSSAHRPALRRSSVRTPASTSTTSRPRRPDSRSGAATPCVRSPPPTARWSSSLRSEQRRPNSARFPDTRWQQLFLHVCL